MIILIKPIGLINRLNWSALLDLGLIKGEA